MGTNTKIEWATHSWSPWWGCIEVSPACDNCYARELAHRYGHNVWGKDAPRREMKEAHWQKPYTWNRAAEKAEKRVRVFPSMCDPFEYRLNDGGQLDRLRGDFWCLTEGTPWIDWLLLTKRPNNVERLIPDRWREKLPDNVWIGATVEDRARLWRIDELRKVDARVRFLSIEPLLEDLGTLDLTGIDWVITGGESGHKARVTHPDWLRAIRDQCNENGVAYLHKQNGEFVWIGRGHGGSDDVEPKPVKVGKKAAGRKLDSQTWDQFPEVRA